MNHDVTHCADYQENRCPKSCQLALLTKDLTKIIYLLPTSWAHFRETKDCPRHTNRRANE